LSKTTNTNGVVAAIAISGGGGNVIAAAAPVNDPIPTPRGGSHNIAGAHLSASCLPCYQLISLLLSLSLYIYILEYYYLSSGGRWGIDALNFMVALAIILIIDG